MQIFAVSHALPEGTRDALETAVVEAAGAFPRIDTTSVVTLDVSAHRVAMAAVAHPDDLAAPRRYRAQHGDVIVLFDGLPVDRRDGFAACDAAALLRHWDELPERLDGAFTALRIDAASGDVECLVGPLALAQAYIVRCEAGWAVSNSVDVIRLAFGLSEPDPLAASSLLAIGWLAGGRSLLRGVRVLEAGSLHRLTRLVSNPVVTPATLAPTQRERAAPLDELACNLTRTMRAATSRVRPVSCGLTAGRDSRVVLGLALAAGAPVECFTSGARDDLDVREGARIADVLSLPHTVVAPNPPANLRDWWDLTSRYTAQTDGSASLWDIEDWLEHHSSRGDVGVKLSGAGGEIGRLGGRIGLGNDVASVLPGIRLSWNAQRRVLVRRFLERRSAMTRDAVRESLAHIDGFLADRRQEGWRPYDALAAYYAFERVQHWGASGIRRAAAATDVFTPFASRDYLRASLALRPRDRYDEVLHRGLLEKLNPTLRDLPFAHRPWGRNRGRLAELHVLEDVGRRVFERGRARLLERAPRVPGVTFRRAWLDFGWETAREVILSYQASPLWSFVNRPEVERVFGLTRVDRVPHAETMSRVVTLFWWFHARHDARAV